MQGTPSAPWMNPNPIPIVVARPPSPSPTADYSIISPDEVQDVFSNPYDYQYSTMSTRRLASLPLFQSSRSQGMHASSSYGPSFVNPASGSYFNNNTNTSPAPTLGNENLTPFSYRESFASTPTISTSYTPEQQRTNAHATLRSLIPRLLEILSSPSRTTLYPAAAKSRTPSPARKGKGRALSSTSQPRFSYYDQYGDPIDCSDSYIDYSELPPLDGEEGELIDDEACFVDVRAVTGIDPLSILPTELALHLFTLLDLPALLAALSVSHEWNALASDNAVWRSLFSKRTDWAVSFREESNKNKKPHPHNNNPTRPLSTRAPASSILPIPVTPYNSNDGGYKLGSSAAMRINQVIDEITAGQEAMMASVEALIAGKSIPPPKKPLKRAVISPRFEDSVDWRFLYRERHELDQRWAHGEPVVKRIEGHSDSVYCLEFDSRWIITGSRDRTIKVWGLKTGKLLGTMRGHAGSVLCLKFDFGGDTNASPNANAENDGHEERSDEYLGEQLKKRGFMVSGSSDCSVCVWDLVAVEGCGIGESVGERAVEPAARAEVRAVLKGHSGGVLDLRIDSLWVVSCSKDGLIRVWDRKTLELHRTLRGHEGPVNAVGLQSGKVVSASGDGKMMLWDIESGERLRTFEGHDRGLACIEFKDDLIVSGSNDCKIKIWSASTGKCLKTLVGHDSLVRALSFDPKSGRLVSASYDKTVKVWDLRTQKLVREFKSNHVSHIFDVKFDVARIVSTSHDQKIVVLDFAEDLDVSMFV